MPLSVEIKINGREIETVWIGRLDRFQGEDHWHQYIVGVGTRTTPPWASSMGDPLPEFPRFRHRYRDGARRCVMRALNALERWETKKATEFQNP